MLEGILQNRKNHLISFYFLYFGKETDNVYIPEDDDGVDGDDEWQFPFPTQKEIKWQLQKAGIFKWMCSDNF